VEALEPQGLADGRELLDEAVDLPQRPVVRPVGPPAPELVVEDDAAAVGKALELLEIVVREARTAVEAEQRRTVAVGGDVADAPVPDPPAADIDEALPPRGPIL
jgi:hypothetical protein